ncbi:hypothetical protein AgCh_014072 [Apium graveolens]
MHHRLDQGPVLLSDSQIPRQNQGHCLSFLRDPLSLVGDAYLAVAVVMIADLMGEALEVPDRMFISFSEAAGDQAARVFNPGDVTSGFRICGVKAFGPYEENEVIRGACRDPSIIVI